MRFFGQYLQRLDNKHRVVVPSKFRETIGEAELRNGLFVARGFDGCLFLFPLSLWDAVEAEFSAGHFMTADARNLQRVFFGNTVQVETDKLGRILLPDHLRDLAGIEDQALFVGAFNRIELWCPARWLAIAAKNEERTEELAESFYKLLQGRNVTQ